MTQSTGEMNSNFVNLPVAAEAIYEGYVYKITSGNLTVITAKGDAAFAVAAKSTRDPQLNTALTMTAGDMWAFYLLGGGNIVNVAAVAGDTWKLGAKVYLDTSVDGMVTTDLDTNGVCIGHYKGKESLVIGATDGVLIQVILDVPSTAATT